MIVSRREQAAEIRPCCGIYATVSGFAALRGNYAACSELGLSE
jgi:hypothetical protein